jgi:hypothetical protein
MLVALALLATLAPPAFAGPPDGVSGRMVLDEVADGLRRYHKETDETRRVEWLWKLARTRDPRVAVALGEAMRNGQYDRVRLHACWAIEACYSRNLPGFPYNSIREAQRWWNANEADLRRRAQELP